MAIVLLIIYFVVIVFIGITVSQKSQKKTGVTEEEYFLASKSLNWMVIAGTMAASWTGVSMLV